MNELTLRPIAYIHNDFPEKFGIPRQSGLADTLSEIIFEKEYGQPEAFRDLEGFSYIWLLWGFSGNRPTTSQGNRPTASRGNSPTTSLTNLPTTSRESLPTTSRENSRNWHPTVRPPKLGGNTRVGVYASRSPFRPNPIGLSSVELVKIEQRADIGMVLTVRGADLMDGTPIYDVKPYLPYADSHPDAACGFTGQISRKALQVEFPEALLAMIPSEKRPGLLDILKEDPRPSYQNDPDRTYGLSYAGYNILFRVEELTLYVLDIKAITSVERT